MEKEFVPYELAVKLKELGCDRKFYNGFVNGILWQQAFDWFRNNGYYVNYQSEENFTCFKRVTPNMEILSFVRKYDVENHYEQARQACLEKLIEIWKKK